MMWSQTQMMYKPRLQTADEDTAVPDGAYDNTLQRVEYKIKAMTKYTYKAMVCMMKL